MSEIKSGLGACLVAQARYAEAEPLLVGAFQNLGPPSNTPGETEKLRRELCENVVGLYEAWDKSEPGKGHDLKAAEWKSRLDVAPDAARTPGR